MNKTELTRCKILWLGEVCHLQDRRLVAILAADIAGYSRLMGQDEAATIADLKAHQAVVLPMIGQYGGQIIDLAGDGILGEFPSAVRIDRSNAFPRDLWRELGIATDFPAGQ